MTAALPVHAWGRDVLAARADDVLDVYAEAMGTTAAEARARKPLLTGHLRRPGVAAAAALDGRRLVAVAYGFPSEAGQWWHDRVREALPPGDRALLDDAFEVCELHVRPGWQGRGLGRGVLDTLLTGRPEGRAVLSTPQVPGRAWDFYAAHGWQPLLQDLRFPGDPRTFAVLARRLALATPGA